MENDQLGRLPARIPAWLAGVAFTEVVRIDVGLEGDWSATVRAIWTPADGFLVFLAAGLRHAKFRPSLELYFDAGWIGIHCYRVVGGEFVLDEDEAAAIVEYVGQFRAAERPDV